MDEVNFRTTIGYGFFINYEDIIEDFSKLNSKYLKKCHKFPSYNELCLFIKKFNTKCSKR
jgi:hypothetical protein